MDDPAGPDAGRRAGHPPRPRARPSEPLYVTDLVEGVLAAATNPAGAGRVFN
ncbi:MAG: NAD-dependent epimerase/dehydratase family protein [Microthrixaceae bacterium]|nr:NAD-dependent epimerase/dehydratase family protein [Microthrixaceae bacterium]